MDSAPIAAPRRKNRSIRLTEEEDKLLRDRAFRLRVSRAEIIRKGLTSQLAAERRYQGRRAAPGG